MVRISEEIMIKFLNNECTTEELREVEQWIGESDDNARELFGLEAASCAASAVSDDAQSRSRVAGLIQSKIEAYEAMRRRARRLSIVRWSAAAVVAGVVATLAFVFMHRGVEMVTVDTYAESKMVVLPDSSRVWLNEYASLSYPKEFSDHSREISLKGEAYFEVTKDAARPFRVTGDYLTVEVLGTKFNFFSSAKRENFVSLIEGKVEVKPNSNKDGIVIAPGQKLTLNPENAKINITEGNVALDAVWHNGMIPFSNATISEIAQDLETLYNIDIVIRPSVNTAQTYSGASPKYESIDSTLSALCNTLPIVYTRQDDKIIFSGK